MAVSRQAIESFLEQRGPVPLKVKGLPEDKLLELVERYGGQKPRFKNKPRRVQLEAFVFALWARYALLYYQMRTGKTGTALYFIEYLKQISELKCALIIAHSPVGVDEWEGQYELYCDLNIHFIRTPDEKSRTAGNDAFELLCAAFDDNADAIVITWSTLQLIFSEKRLSRKKRAKLYPAKDKLSAVAEYFNVLIVDEVHFVMNNDSLRFLMASELAVCCEWAICMTGTAFGRDPYGLWAQAFLTDGGKSLSKNFYFFQQAFGKKKYNHFNKRQEEWVFDDDKMGILQDKLNHMTLFCQLSEVQEVNVLPGVIKLKLGRQQLQEYNKIVDRIIEKGLANEQEAENTFVRFRQISSGYLVYKDEHGKQATLDFLECTKMQWLEELLLEFPKDMKGIIVHEFTHTGELLTGLMKKLKLRHDWLYGATKDRPALKQRFQEGNTQWLVMNWQTGGTGINLSAADYLLFYESPVSVIARKQTEYRPLDRNGRLLVMDDLVCSPVEKKIIGYLDEGRDLNARFEGSSSLFRTFAK